MNITETWKDIPGYENLYQASSLGRIRTKEDKITYRIISGKRQKRIWKSRILKEKNPKGPVGRGDKRYDLWKNGKPKTFLGHRLIALTFLSNPENKPCVNHKNGNFRDNRLENLEWVTYSENQNHAFENRLIKTANPIILYNFKEKNMHYFRSKAEASKFLNKSHGYISNLLKKGTAVTEDYMIFTHKEF